MSEIQPYEETHFERLDRDRMALDAEYRKAEMVEAAKTQRAKLEARGHVMDAVKNVGIAFAAAATACCLFIVVWQAGEGPSEEQRLEDKWRTQCIESGGSWVPNSGDDMCIAPGESTLED